MTQVRSLGARRGANFAALGLALWIGLPLLVVAGVSFRDHAARLDAPTTTWVEPTRISGDTAAPIGLLLTWSPPVALPAPAWNGLVEAVWLSPHKTLVSGGRVAVIGGVLRLAYHSPRPFGRALSSGDQGQDVTQLNELLRSRQLPAGKSDTYDKVTQRGVKKLAGQLGVRGDDDHFDPGWIVFLANRTVSVDKVDLSVGMLAPSAGTTMATGSGALRRAELITEASLTSAQERLSASSDSEASGTDLSDVVQTVQAPEGASLSVAGRAVALDRTRRTLDPRDLPSVAAILTPSSRVFGAQLRRHPGPDEWQLPVPSIFAGPDGGTCLLIRHRDEAAPEVVMVQVLDSSASTANVRAQLRAGDEIGLDPPANQRRCG